jgi:hypothetical protein
MGTCTSSEFAAAVYNHVNGQINPAFDNIRRTQAVGKDGEPLSGAAKTA